MLFRSADTQGTRLSKLQRMTRLSLVLPVASIVGCANTEYRFERIDGEHPIILPFKLDGVYGVRDGASVNAEARFTDGADVLTMNIAVRLVPPAEFRSGTYRATIGGKTTAGRVECTSLMYLGLGGPADQPSVGGVFILKDEQNRSIYRVRIPATTMTRRSSLRS